MALPHMVPNKKYTYIDSIRGYAVLMVLCTHVWGIICNRSGVVFLSNFWQQCRMGVMLFFMISALTLFLSLDLKIKTERYPIGNFFIRRVFRIVPLFYIILLGYLVFDKHSTITILSTFTFTNGFIPDVMIQNPILIVGWTLAIEMIFYMMLPVIFRFVRNINSALILFLITLVLSFIAKLIAFKYLNSYYPHITLVTFTYYWLPAQLPVFSLGIVVYFLLFKIDYADSIEAVFKKYFGYSLMLLGIYFAIVLSFATKLFVTENIAFSFALVLFIAGMAFNPSSIFNNRVARFLGKISYSFYLIHIIIIDLFLKYLPGIRGNSNKSFIIGLITILIATSAVSYLSYLIIEQPFQKLGARLIAKSESRQSLQNSSL
jgi:peptidoglycan/LPS O-acetylase OafA/YrhL